MIKQVELEREVQNSHARLARVEARLQQIEQEGKTPPYEVTTKSTDGMVIASCGSWCQHHRTWITIANRCMPHFTKAWMNWRFCLVTLK